MVLRQWKQWGGFIKYSVTGVVSLSVYVYSMHDCHLLKHVEASVLQRRRPQVVETGIEATDHHHHQHSEEHKQCLQHVRVHHSLHATLQTHTHTLLG